MIPPDFQLCQYFNAQFGGFQQLSYFNKTILTGSLQVSMPLSKGFTLWRGFGKEDSLKVLR